MHTIYPLKYEELVSKYSLQYDVEKELIFAVIKCESGFDQEAHSHANAQGLMQMTPETFNWINECYIRQQELNVSELKKPELNVRCGTLLLSILLKKYKNEKLALSAYNAGISTVDRWIKNNVISSETPDLSCIPYKETKNYVKRVTRAKKIYKKLYFTD